MDAVVGEVVVKLRVSGFFLEELNPQKLNPLKLESLKLELSKGDISSIGSSDSVREICRVG